MTTTAITIDLAVDRDLQDLMDDLVAGHSGPDIEPDPAAVWATLGAVGLARLTAPEETGGSGAGWVEAAALLRTTAAGGVAVPFAETDLLAGPLRRAAGLDDSSSDTATVAVLRADGLARRVPWAGVTGSVVCVRRVDAGYELADVPTDRLTVEAVEGISEVPLGSVQVDGDVTWSPVDTRAVEGYVLRGALIRAIQCVGAMEGMLASAVAHTTDRAQFGRPLARFQSVQNLVVDTAAESVLAGAAVDTALADAVTDDLAGDFSAFRVAVARSVVSQALAVAVRNTHQVHGAIGTTHEHTLHRLTLPALQWRSEFGSAAFWERQLSCAAVDAGMDGTWPMIVEGTRITGPASAYLDAVSGRSRPD
ncbi:MULTISPECIES: acyl-CoA dehydrogenase family protein [Rhodococcus]|uniref:Acyl-CoA dehydrogenase n=2 Tax=Rhodococcus pyridinivorans TaxID=103816 RepID=H0JLT1_9NOCA|nr:MULTISPECIES: acyl-CoA dehydrogenase family protein [Rhodococcus]EHK85833.1 acyl-CoA dehydrogenase [Rhodococcus pyridinivorans AK37]KHJ72584.1 acyl-CoA dehydrogenase [Rhodococcus sp. Chr-9]KSZ56062.1 acyl-CoA dehydrogenase [Rhodococcus pyridinivorans KG-16]MBX4171517.1 acyl-CoA dehydrogenase family protein [Rhodococcus sp. DMU2021]MCD2143517.1 acyl-CoA dehydrogenase family protein [Rhodococcus pyridinivorans]